MKHKLFRFIAIVILSVTLSLIYSCSTPFRIFKEKESIGKNQITKADIQADLFFFEERIDDFYLDTTTNTLTVQLRGITPSGRWLENHGHMILYNLNTDSAIWSKKINYNTDGIFQYNNMIIRTNGVKSFGLNNQTGEAMWGVKNNLIFTDFNQNIGFGFKYRDDIRKTIEGVNLTIGRPIWKRVIDSDYGWNSISHLNDSVMLVAAEGLHSIDLKTGRGWDYRALTGKKDYSGTVAKNAAGLAVGLLTGVFMYSTGYDTYHDMVSNTWIDSTSIYWAAKQKILKLNHEGQMLWEYGFPQDEVSKSEIFIKDSLVYMVNFGFVYLNNYMVDFGIPFVAAFNHRTGQKVFISELNDKKSSISDFSIQNQDLLIMSNTRISKFSMTSGTLLQEKTINTDSLGLLIGFVSKDSYIKRDSIFKTLDELDSTNKYVRTSKNKIIEINDKFEVVNQFENLTLYLPYMEKDGYKFIGSFNESYILDKDGKVVANIKVSMNAVLIGTKLYDKKDDAMVIVDLKELLKI